MKVAIVCVSIVWALSLCALAPLWTSHADESCSEITAVRHIPFQREDQVDDVAYNALRTKGWSVVPCLINKISDMHTTPDPRSAPRYSDVRVGDVAFWIIKDITGLPYDQMFPAKLRKRFPKEGVYAYFDWIKRANNRKLLQQNVRNWYLQNARNK